ncbi:MAG: M20/M25/M40 family metallo-hydrolase [Bryobacteraceae bacterium]|nr:M20/M25/M40 family metallo-hydrolase [Bryobacteraceae bacterium]
MRFFRLFTGLLVLACLWSAAASRVPGRPRVSGRAEKVKAEKLLEDIRYLTSAALTGRSTGSPGLNKAAIFIAGEFSRAGLKAGGDAGYYQSFPVTLNARSASQSWMKWTVQGRTEPLEPGSDFEPYAFSSSAPVTGRVVFAGYGITACEYGYDDYEGLDVRNKIVLILRHEPQEYDTSSSFEGRIYTEHSQLYRKLLNAKAHGASAVLLVNDIANHTGADSLERLTALPSPGGAGIPFVGIRSSVVEQWFTDAGRSFSESQKEIDRTGSPDSFEFPEIFAELATPLQSETRYVSNVVGVLPGTSEEYVVVGAHYDHLGGGEQFSLAPEKTGTLHPGADDNASGTAAVISIARTLAAQPPMKRGVVFVAFAGEEIGLVGSTWFTAFPKLPLHNAVAMINMDMIGRVKEQTLIVGGVDSGTELRQVLETAAKSYPFTLQTGTQAVYGSSDHTAFTAHSVPSLFFFTGLHADYHRPTDTADKINIKSTGLIADLVAEVTMTLAERVDRPVFRRRSDRTCSSQKFSHTVAGAGR